MRIALISPNRGSVGGWELHIRDLEEGLSKRGHEVVSIRVGALAARAGSRTSSGSNEGLRGIDVVYFHGASAAEDLEAFNGLPVLVATHEHDLTCVRSHRYLPLSLEPCHRPPGFECVQHGCIVVRNRHPTARLPLKLRSPFRLRSRLQRLAARAPIVACSRYVRDNLVSAGVPAQRAHVIHPIPPEDERPRTRRPGVPTLVVAGNLLRGKGVDLAIDALSHLPDDTTLSVIGDGPSRPALERRARTVAPDRVHFEGWASRSSVVDAYDRASVVLVPSRWPEPFGMVGLEAMRRARPVAASAHGGIPEWATGTRGAQLFAPGDPRSLARAVGALLEDPEAGKAALRHARRYFPHARLFEETEALLGEVARAAESSESSQR